MPDKRMLTERLAVARNDARHCHGQLALALALAKDDDRRELIQAMLQQAESLRAKIDLLHEDIAGEPGS